MTITAARNSARRPSRHCAVAEGVAQLSSGNPKRAGLDRSRDSQHLGLRRGSQAGRCYMCMTGRTPPGNFLQGDATRAFSSTGTRVVCG